MTAPTVTLSVTDRCRLKDLEWQQSQIVQPGKVMFCKGRKVMGYTKVTDLARLSAIPTGADVACVSAADFEDVRRWLG
jgi:hypothetical protein